MANNSNLSKKGIKDETYADMWDLYHSLSSHIATQLRRFLEAEKRKYHTVPGDFKSEKDWHAALRTMIRAFDLIANPSTCPLYRDSRLSEEEQEILIQDGLQLFCKYLRSLWI